MYYTSGTEYMPHPVYGTHMGYGYPSYYHPYHYPHYVHPHYHPYHMAPGGATTYAVPMQAPVR